MPSSKEPCRERVVSARLLLILLHSEGASAPTSGEGSGVMSVIAARYGEGRAELEPGESEDARLVLETLERREEPMG